MKEKKNKRENLTHLHVNNKVKDQPVHPPSLISAFVISRLKSKIAKPAMCKVSKF